ncbi:MAG: response regulator [SAR324 cluster bacterium]|nr:response regulator [SAR324 cluster bacterium]
MNIPSPGQITIFEWKDHVFQAFDLLQEGLVVVAHDLSIMFVNQWLRTRLPASLGNPTHLIQILDSRIATELQMRISNILNNHAAQSLVPEWPNVFIPLEDTRCAGQMMPQKMMLTAVGSPPADNTNQCYGIIQIFDVSDLVLKCMGQEDQLVELKQTIAEAEEVRLSQRRYLASMGHEIRNPLNSILGFSQMLTKSMDSLQNPPEYARFIHNIGHASESLNEVLDNFFDLIQMDSETMELHEERIDLKQLLQNVCYIQKKFAAINNSPFFCEPSEDLPRYIFADRAKLSHVLITLTSQAIMMNSAEGMVSLVIEPHETMLRLRVTVTNSGPVKTGSHNSDQKQTALRKVAKLVQAMGGNFIIPDRMGNEPEFIVQIPVRRDALPDSHEGETLPAFLKENQILVAEDNLMNQELIHAIFESLELDIHLMTTGQDLLDHLVSAPATLKQPHLILLDMHLPDMTGVEIIQKIRTIPGMEAIPIVVYSGDELTRYQQQFSQFGVHDFLQKPLLVDNLVPVLKRYLLKSENQIIAENATPHKLSPQQLQQLINEWNTLAQIPMIQTEALVDQLDLLKRLYKQMNITPLQPFQPLEESLFEGNQTKTTHWINQELKHGFFI